MTGTRASFRLCPRCSRAVPLRSGEHYCINDGTPLLEACPSCHSRITSPHARHCANCGFRFADVLEAGWQEAQIQNPDNPTP